MQVKFKTLSAVPNSKLHVKFKNKSGEKTIFVDRDEKHFRNMINYLRNNFTISDFDSLFEKNEFLKELKFWGIPDKTDV